ncbi:hypothetical protein WJX74_006471 [Apatococcus lobatus]|uniref:Uncharacterized protein n=1 Tax=Apatococcus lobatus TaxID=904363 RepID=A0AAW1RLS5_9CHLO
MALGFKPVDTLQQLHQERLRLLNAVNHLQQSNAALEEESQSDPDPELRDAVRENVLVLAKYRTKVTEIEEELQLLEPASQGHAQHGQHSHLSSTQHPSNGGTHGFPDDEIMPDADVT